MVNKEDVGVDEAVVEEAMSFFIRTENRSAAGANTTSIAFPVASASTVTDKVSASFGADDEQIMMPQPLTITGRVVVTI